jgi:hypothetical protein
MSRYAMRAGALLLTAGGLGTVFLSAAQAQMLSFSEQLTFAQRVCVGHLLSASDWMPEDQAEMLSIAQAATTRLSYAKRAYVYVFEGRGWCGTAGCPLLIGEMGWDGMCRTLYDAFGDQTFTVLPQRDNGYRRIYAPCEARFDGRQYQQIHEDCPSPRAWR